MVSVVAKLRFNDTRIKDRSLITGRESTKQDVLVGGWGGGAVGGCQVKFYLPLQQGAILKAAGIFLENNFKYQNAHNKGFGGAISANYGDFFTISCFLFDIFRRGMAP